MKTYATGRWNRDLGHVGSLVHSGGGVWFECSCGAQGEPRTSTAEADADGDAHERGVHAQRKQGRRFVRGRWE